MALDELTQRRVQAEVAAYIEAKRPPAQIRPQLDIQFKLENQSIVIFEVRPHWQKVGEILRNEVAKASYIKTRNVWKIFWMRADLKWHGYEPHLYSETVKEFLEIVEEDEYACFWG